MSIGLLSVLKIVPWADVISNAPVVADGAKKLWKAVGKKAPPQAPDPVSEPTTTTDRASPDAQAIAVLEARLASMETATAELHAQMLESSALMTSLAELNNQLIERVNANRIRVIWLALATFLTGSIAVASLVMTLGYS